MHIYHGRIHYHTRAPFTHVHGAHFHPRVHFHHPRIQFTQRCTTSKGSTTTVYTGVISHMQGCIFTREGFTTIKEHPSSTSTVLISIRGCNSISTTTPTPTSA